MSGPTRHNRNTRDANEQALLDVALKLGGHWFEHGPFDGYIWVPRLGLLRMVEIKIPERQGLKHEFTPLQIRAKARCELIGLPIFIWRTTADVIRDIG